MVICDNFLNGNQVDLIIRLKVETVTINQTSVIFFMIFVAFYNLNDFFFYNFKYFIFFVFQNLKDTFLKILFLP